MDAKIFAVLALIAVGISPGWGEDEVKSKSEKVDYKPLQFLGLGPEYYKVG